MKKEKELSEIKYEKTLTYVQMVSRESEATNQTDITSLGSIGDTQMIKEIFDARNSDDWDYGSYSGEKENINKQLYQVENQRTSSSDVFCEIQMELSNH